MAVRVLIRRKIRPNSEPKLHEALLRLRAKAMGQEGYISGETLRNVDNPSEIIVISTWNKLADWKAWENHPERRAIEQEVAGLLEGPEQASVYTYP